MEMSCSQLNNGFPVGTIYTNLYLPRSFGLLLKNKVNRENPTIKFIIGVEKCTKSPKYDVKK